MLSCVREDCVTRMHRRLVKVKKCLLSSWVATMTYLEKTQIALMCSKGLDKHSFPKS